MLSQTLVENDHSINDVCRTANIFDALRTEIAQNRLIIFSLYITIALDKLRMKDGINEKAESLIDTDFLIELRRNAYIECTENYLSTDTVAGIFGDELPEELFYARSCIHAKCMFCKIPAHVLSGL